MKTTTTALAAGSSSSTMPALTFNHGTGSGPAVANFLAEYRRGLAVQPTSILIVEAHMKHTPSSVQIAGDAALVSRVATHLQAANIHSQRDRQSGGEGHGSRDVMRAFKGVPIAAMSVQTNGADPRSALALGQALAPLRQAGTLILGSGVPSFHNFGLLRPGMEQERKRHTAAFSAWLRRAVATADADTRMRTLAAWRSAPSAESCHPGHDTHFTPTLVVAGACLGLPGRPVHQESQALILPMLAADEAKHLHHFEFS